jgi:MFS transporter, NNP family, nitrate/nitrite transporter
VRVPLKRDGTVSPEQRGMWMLAVATVGYLLSVWAWTLLGPLAPMLRDTLGLSAVEQALMVALPVVVGSLGRIPAGALTDRFGGRAMFLLIMLITVVGLVAFAAVGHRSVPGVMIGAAFLGIAGTSFAAGVPFVTAWFAGARRGLALGVFGVGVWGSAVAGLTAVRLADAYSMAMPFLVSAAVLAAFMLVAAVAMRDAPQRPRPDVGVGRRLTAAFRLPITWQASLWFAIVLALFITFSSYLPAYLTNAYGMDTGRTGDLLAAFVIVAVLMRPVGGWLSDRFFPARPLTVALVVLTVATAVQAATPPLPLVVGGTLPVLAVALGVASGATLAQVAAVAPLSMVGLVAGVGTAVAGIAGFASPLLMAVSLDRQGSYGPALTLLAVGAGVAAITAAARIRSPVSS